MHGIEHTLTALAQDISANRANADHAQRRWCEQFLLAEKHPGVINELALLSASMPAFSAIPGWYSYFFERAQALISSSQLHCLSSTDIEELDRFQKRFSAFAGEFSVACQHSSDPLTNSRKHSLTIGIDIRPLLVSSSRTRGIGRYLMSTLSRLVRSERKHRFVFLSDSQTALDDELVNMFSVETVSFRSFGPNCDIGLDAFLLTDPLPMLTGRKLSELPVTRCPWMSIIYDFIPLEYPELYLRGANELTDEYLGNMEIIAQRCQAIFPISRYVAERCEAILSFPSCRVIPIYGGVDDAFFINVSKENLSREIVAPYFLYVGGADARKNLSGLINGFHSALPDLPNEFKLILVGEMNAARTALLLKSMHRTDLLNRVTGIGGVDDERLKSLYAHAVATVFVSHSEGFGLPALEAMAAGCPMIASKTTALGETVASNGVLVDPASTSEIATAMREVSQNHALRRDLSERGVQHARKWRWESVASELLAGIEKFAMPPKTITTKSRKLRVAMLNRENVWSAPGGDSQIMLQMQAAASTRDVEVFFPSVIEQIESSDVVHFINMTLPKAFADATRIAQASNKPLVTTTLFEDWPLYLNASHRSFTLYREFMAGRKSYRELSDQLRLLRTNEDSFNLDVLPQLEASARLLACGDSEAMRLKRVFPAVAGRVEVLPFQVNSPSVPEDESIASLHESLGFTDYVLCIGRLETRKNQLALLSALHDVDIPIVFATGGFTPQPAYAQAVRSWKRKAPLKFVDRVPWQIMSMFIHGASVHALPSFYELPGLVHLECAAAGINIVASDWGALSDYLPDSMYFRCDPLDLESIRTAVVNGLQTPLNPTASVIAQGYTQNQLADNLCKVYEDVVTTFSRNNSSKQKTVHRHPTPVVSGGLHATV